MGRVRPSIPVYNYKQDYSVNNLVSGVPYLITAPSIHINRLVVSDASGDSIDFMIGVNPDVAFTIPQGGGEFEIQLCPGMLLYLSTNSGSNITQGKIIVTGYK